MSGQPFCRCTHTALSPKGEIYVSDGYGNARVHKYAPDGNYLFSWGKCGIGEGEFNLPHNIHCDADGWVYVADRENHRVQVFDGNGRTSRPQWSNVVHRPSALLMTGGHVPAVLHRRGRAVSGLQPRLSQSGAAHLRPVEHRQAAGPSRIRGRTRTARSRDSSCRRTASPWIRTATCMWARSRWRPGRRCSPASRGRTGCAACRSW